ncbi:MULTISPECIES: hypothetical protein [Pseudomonas]|jgi:hypothetical protein|uniref:Uncharacterized protein n=1 Tax=Pseudomonas syringae pv. aptata TaxID=83167 RepID=A0A0Q0CH95_PSEAP|nr:MULTISPECIES: hypothetical protein [Pseudomonas]KPZ04052.1 hypothetical protein ALO85_200120 [Pseudomonas syringae pv. aptata]PBP92462.1 hypothetical protein CCL16_03180 [Pseudomonas syringae]PBP92530.1 hypothetical protein CCL16_03550 [Pseudomonas syringae]POP72812.1 hypothetical protein CXB37_25730 [Pseudomonas syringae pv. syringae]RMO62944.1 hypothetical protein ALQ37_02777 [Pseudomonas syringae pv. aptata]
MSPSDIAGNESYSSEQAAFDMLSPQQRDTFAILLADIGKAMALDRLCERRGKAMGYALGLLSCQAIDGNQLAGMEREANTAFKLRFEAVQPL